MKLDLPWTWDHGLTITKGNFKGLGSIQNKPRGLYNIQTYKIKDYAWDVNQEYEPSEHNHRDCLRNKERDFIVIAVIMSVSASGGPGPSQARPDRLA